MANSMQLFTEIPTKEEVAKIEEFRRRLKDILLTEEHRSDQYLIRWIRAREYNLDKAEELLRNHLKWRKEYDVDHALDKPRDPFLSETFPYWLKGWGKGGHVVLEFPLGSWDIRKALVGPNGEEKFMQYTNQMLERMLYKIREGNVAKILKGQWPSTQLIGILDWEGYSYSQFIHLKALQNLITLISKYEAHYPEIVFKCFFINCPSIFPLFYAMVKPILAPRTLAKINIFGSNKQKWKSAIREWADPDQLGIQFGGICTDRTINSMLYDLSCK